MFGINDVDVKNVKPIAMPGGSLMELGLYLQDASMMDPSLFGPPFYSGTCNLFSLNHFGCYCCVGFDNQLLSVHMGNYSSVGHGCRFGLGQHDQNLASTSPCIFRGKYTGFPLYTYDDPYSVETRTLNSYAHINVGHDVSIGNNVLMPSDLSIGTGAIIESGTVVTKNVPPFAIVRGVNTIAGQRFSDEVISDLMELKWWDYNLPLMRSEGAQIPDEIHDFIAWFKDLAPNEQYKLSTTRFLVDKQCLEGGNIIGVVDADCFKFDWERL